MSLGSLRRYLLLLLATAALAAGGGATASDAGPAIALGPCDEAFAFIPVSAEDVDRFVPEGYTLVESNFQPGTAEIFVDVVRCDRIRSRAGGLYTHLSVHVVPPDGFDSTSHIAGTPGGADFYLISWVTDNRDFDAWLKAGTGLEDRVVRYVKDLAYAATPLVPSAAFSFVFDAPSPTPSPFRVTATATEPLAPFPVTANYWWETSAGKTLRIEALHPVGEEGTLGSAEGTLSTERGSQLAEMLGGNESASFDGSSFRFAVGEFTKKVFPR